MTDDAIAITFIAAMDLDGVIGADGGMPWHLPADLKWFKNQTRGKPVLMGRRTFESIGRALPNRRNIVMTRRADAQFPGCETVGDIDSALGRIDPAGDGRELMVIGGAEIFALALPQATRMLITRIQARYAGDTWFPDIDWPRWRCVDEQTLHGEGDTPGACFVTYERRTA